MDLLPSDGYFLMSNFTNVTNRVECNVTCVLMSTRFADRVMTASSASTFPILPQCQLH